MSRKKRKNVGQPLVERQQRDAGNSVRVVTRIGSGTLPPAPMAEPKIDPDFDRLVPAVRTAEVCRYTAASTLYRISPGGWLLAWWRLCIIGVLILLPVFVLLYLASVGLSTVLHPLEQAALALRQIATHLVAVAALITGLILAYFLTATLLKGLTILTKNTLLPTLFAVLVLLLALAAGIAWLASQFPLIERLLNGFLNPA